MKTIRSKIMLCMTLTLVIALLTVGVITAVENYTSTLSTLEQTMTVTAKVVSDRLEHELNGYLNLCCEIGSISEFSNPRSLRRKNRRSSRNASSISALRRAICWTRKGEAFSTGQISATANTTKRRCGAGRLFPSRWSAGLREN